jgi:hypothetical protein
MTSSQRLAGGCLTKRKPLHPTFSPIYVKFAGRVLHKEYFKRLLNTLTTR